MSILKLLPIIKERRVPATHPYFVAFDECVFRNVIPDRWTMLAIARKIFPDQRDAEALICDFFAIGRKPALFFLTYQLQGQKVDPENPDFIALNNYFWELSGNDRMPSFERFTCKLVKRELHHTLATELEIALRHIRQDRMAALKDLDHLLAELLSKL